MPLWFYCWQNRRAGCESGTVTCARQKPLSSRYRTLESCTAVKILSGVRAVRTQAPVFVPREMMMRNLCFHLSDFTEHWNYMLHKYWSCNRNCRWTKEVCIFKTWYMVKHCVPLRFKFFIMFLKRRSARCALGLPDLNRFYSRFCAVFLQL